MELREQLIECLLDALRFVVGGNHEREAAVANAHRVVPNPTAKPTGLPPAAAARGAHTA